MKRFFILISDIAMLYGALALMLLVRYEDRIFALRFSQHLFPFSVIFIIWILVFYITNLYETRSLRNDMQFFSDLLRAGVLASILTLTAFYFLSFRGITPKTNFLIFLIIFSALETGSRSLINRALKKGFQKRIAVVGSNPQALELAQLIRTNPQLGYYLVRTIDVTPSGGTSDINGVKRLVTSSLVDTIVVSPEAYHNPELINIFYRSLKFRVAFRNLASFHEQVTGRVPLGAIDQIWFLENLSENSRRAYEVLKRGIDAILSVVLSLGYIVLLPFIALIIRLDSPGPIFYRQRRLGQAGKMFDIVKFRTMHNNAEKISGAVWAQDNDPRVTRLGRFLRKSRLDELPQLWNILRGEMSFVGPRAERPEFYELLKNNVPFYEERYLIKPGLTGWAQINYRYGSSVKDAAEKLQYDLYYIKNRSLVLDLGIVLRTVNISLRQAGR